MLILTEDYYGPDFFKDLISRLRDMGLIRVSQRVKIDWFPGKCNPKITRILKAKTDMLSKVIIVADAEGECIADARNRIDQHIPSNLRNITRYVVFPYCIEEWICEGLGIRRSKHTHPVVCLNDYLRRTRGEDYEKYMLPDFVDKIDINVLKNNNQEFKNFLQYVNCRM
jgi:hypothetical protein